MPCQGCGHVDCGCKSGLAVKSEVVKGDKEMMRKLMVLWGCVAVTALAWPGAAARATTMVFDSDGVIEAGDLYDIVEIHDTPPGRTTVNMTGGEVGRWGDTDTGLFSYDSSTVNIAGGWSQRLYMHDSSTANISGGWVGDYGAFGETTIAGYDSSTINVYDGAWLMGASATFFELFDSSELNVYGGNVDMFLEAHNSAIVNVYGGSLFTLGLLSGNTVNVYGGYVGAFRANNLLSPTARANFYGHDFEWTAEGYWYGNDPDPGWWISKLTGYGFDGTPITYYGLPDPATHPNIVFIPEPSTFLLGVSGGLWLLRRRA